MAAYGHRNLPARRSISIPTNVYLLGDPRLDNPTWDRMFKTGVIDANGAVRNVQSGESPVFAIRPTNSLRVTPTRFGNLRNLSDQSIDSSLIRNIRFREKWNLQIHVDSFNTLNHPVFSGNPTRLRRTSISAKFCATADKATCRGWFNSARDSHFECAEDRRLECHVTEGWL